MGIDKRRPILQAEDHQITNIFEGDTTNKARLRLAFVTGLLWFSLYSYVPILAPFAVAKGASSLFVGLILGSYGFMQVVFRIPLGVFSDVVGNKLLLIRLGMILALISGLGMWLMPTPTAMLLFRALGGFAASTWVVYIIVFLGYYDEGQLLKAMGHLNFLNAAGQIVAMGLGGFLAQTFGPRITFLLGASGAIVGLGMSKGLRDRASTKHVGAHLPELFRLLQDKILLGISALAAVSQLVSFATVFGFTPLEAKKSGGNDLILGLMTTGYILSLALFSMLSGTFIKKFGLRRCVVSGFVLVALATFAIPLVRSAPFLIALQIVSGLGQGIMFPPLMELSVKHIDQDKRSTATGIFQAIIGLGIFAGPVIVGFVSGTAGLWRGFWIIGLLALLGAVGAVKVIG